MLKVDFEDPQEHPVHVLFNDGEVDHYSLESAAKTMEQLAEPGLSCQVLTQQSLRCCRWRACARTFLFSACIMYDMPVESSLLSSYMRDRVHLVGLVVCLWERVAQTEASISFARKVLTRPGMNVCLRTIVRECVRACLS